MKWDFADIVSFGLFVAGLGAIGHIVYALVRFGFCRLSHAARLSGILRLRQSRQGGSFGVTIRVEFQRIIVSLQRSMRRTGLEYVRRGLCAACHRRLWGGRHVHAPLTAFCGHVATTGGAISLTFPLSSEGIQAPRAWQARISFSMGFSHPRYLSVFFEVVKRLFIAEISQFLLIIR